MGKEFFHLSETAKLFNLLEEVTRRSGVSRAQAFEDFLLMSLASLSGGRMEDQYLQVVAKHTAGKKGKRGCDTIARMFGELVGAMEEDTHEQMKDIIGDLFQGCVSYGEAGQYLTPPCIAQLMASLTLDDHREQIDPELSPDHEGEAVAAEAPQTESPAISDPPLRRTVSDPCCGSGRMLLAAAQNNRHWEFVGQDVDLRCVRMTALNLAFRNLYGYVIWGNTLALEQKLVYRTGFDGRGFVREIPLQACPWPVKQVVQQAIEPSHCTDDGKVTEEDVSPQPRTQLRLF